MIKDKDYFKEKAKDNHIYILFVKSLEEEKSEEQHILEGLKDAYKEWRMNEEYFQWVTDPDLVDYAIYELKASKKKYAYF